MSPAGQCLSEVAGNTICYLGPEHWQRACILQQAVETADGAPEYEFVEDSFHFEVDPKLLSVCYQHVQQHHGIWIVPSERDQVAWTIAEQRHSATRVDLGIGRRTSQEECLAGTHESEAMSRRVTH